MLRAALAVAVPGLLGAVVATGGRADPPSVTFQARSRWVTSGSTRGSRRSLLRPRIASAIRSSSSCGTENDGTGTNQVTLLVVSPSTPVGTRCATYFEHYSLLETTEQLLGLITFLGYGGDPGTATMTSGFNLG